MKNFKVPYSEAEIEFIEKKSRFIGHIYKVSTPEQCQEILAAVRKKYWDATHNVYAYVLQNGVMRFSDDGEPQGTAGQPMLAVFQREQVTNVCCVVTRYFGGILLGAGGLVRAYTRGAKLAVDAAGKSMKRVWTALYIPCPYHLYERVKLEAAAWGAIIRQCDFGAEVELEVLISEAQAEPFLAKLIDMSAGTLEGMVIGQEYRAFPIEN